MFPLAVENLSKSFGRDKALVSLDFTVGEKELYGLIGPDGAGKTTFMRIAACLLFQDSGTVTIHGFDTLRKAKEIKRRIGYMPQRFSLYPDLSVRENLTFYADLFGVGRSERKRRLERLLEFSRLEPFIKRPAGKLSGGMKQKLALSCALIHTPELLLLDEPTTGVDPVSRREFWDILAELKHDGTTIIVSTPYMDEAERCDRIGMLFKGAIISEGEPKEIRKHFDKVLLSVQGDGIVRILRNASFPEQVLAAQTFGDRIHLTVEDENTAVPPVMDFLKKADVHNPAIERIEPSMEDVFMALMADQVELRDG